MVVLDVLYWTLVIVCLILALSGLIPVVAATRTFIVIPFHAFINHYEQGRARTCHGSPSSCRPGTRAP